MANSSYYEQLMSSLVRPTYTSKYQSQIDSLMSSIMNREKFSYDFNADPLYQQYKDQYTKLGNEASMNAIANAAAMTGGFGNSYGATAASQANQQYLTQLNGIIPELQGAALDRYNAEGDRMNRELAHLQDAEAADYGKYQDALAQYNTDYQNAYNGYVDARNYEWEQQQYADAQAAAAAKAAAAKTPATPAKTTYVAPTAGGALLKTQTPPTLFQSVTSALNAQGFPTAPTAAPKTTTTATKPNLLQQAILNAQKKALLIR